MQIFSTSLNIIGLLLDFFGFLGLFFRNPGFIALMNLRDLKILSKFFLTDKNKADELYDDMANKSMKPKTDKWYFLMVAAGFFLQLISAIISFTISISN